MMSFSLVELRFGVEGDWWLSTVSMTEGTHPENLCSGPAPCGYSEN
jgi:hypothetical protein